MKRSTLVRTLVKELCLVLVTSLLAGPALAWQPAQLIDSATLTVTTTVDELASPGTGCSLREAISNANSNTSIYAECYTSGSYGDDYIVFDAATNGLAIVLSGAAGEDANASGDLDILDGGDLTIQGSALPRPSSTAAGWTGCFTSVPVAAARNIIALTRDDHPQWQHRRRRRHL